MPSFRKSPDCVVINATNIGGVESPPSFSDAGATAQHSVDASLDPALAVFSGGDGRLTFQTFDLQSIVTALGLAGVALNGSTGAFMIFRQITSPGVTSTTGTKIAAANGIAYLKRFSASQDANAMCEVEIVGSSTTDANPWAITSSTAALQTASTAPKLYRLGPVKLGTVLTSNVVGVDFSPGYEVYVERSDGWTWPKEAGFASRKPTGSIRLRNLAIAQTYSSTPTDVSGGVTLYFRPVSGYATAAYSSGDNLIITIPECSLKLDSVSGEEAVLSFAGVKGADAIFAFSNGAIA